MSYCAAVATSPDPDDPNLESISMENEMQSHRKIDERLDPYSGRFFPKEPRAEVLAGVLRNENAIEGIVRERVWRVLGERCEGFADGRPWQDSMERWEREHQGRR